MLRTVRMLTLNLISVSPIKQNKTLFLAPENIKLCYKKVILEGECTLLNSFPGPIRTFTIKDNQTEGHPVTYLFIKMCLACYINDLFKCKNYVEFSNKDKIISR